MSQGAQSPKAGEDELRSQVAKLTDELNASRTALRDAQARIEAVEADADVAKKKEHAARSQINRTMAIAEKAENDYKRQKELLQAAIARQDQFKRETKQLQDEIDGYKHKHEMADRELAVTRAECERLGHRIVDTQKIVAQRENEAASSTATLKHQVATLLYEVENERSQRKSAEERLPVLQKQLGELKQKLLDRDRSGVEAVSAKDAEIERLERALAELKEVSLMGIKRVPLAYWRAGGHRLGGAWSPSCLQSPYPAAPLPALTSIFVPLPSLPSLFLCFYPTGVGQEEVHPAAPRHGDGALQGAGGGGQGAGACGTTET